MSAIENHSRVHIAKSTPDKKVIQCAKDMVKATVIAHLVSEKLAASPAEAIAMIERYSLHPDVKLIEGKCTVSQVVPLPAKQITIKGLFTGAYGAPKITIDSDPLQ